MTVEAIASIVAGNAADVAASLAGPAEKIPSSSFVSWLDGQVREAEGQLRVAQEAVRTLAVGGPVEIHDVMIQLDAARFSVELIVTVRDRLLEAYQDVMRMQV